jgi:hypothetical protein
MSSRILPAIALASCLGATIATGAALAATAPPPDPTDARLSSRAPRPTPPATPSSAAVADPGVGNWRAANRAVHEAGGWRQLMRDRPTAAMPAGSAASAAPAASAPSGHHHH